MRTLHQEMSRHFTLLSHALRENNKKPKIYFVAPRPIHNFLSSHKVSKNDMSSLKSTSHSNKYKKSIEGICTRSTSIAKEGNNKRSKMHQKIHAIHISQTETQTPSTAMLLSRN
jgi:hypothetical protein